MIAPLVPRLGDWVSDAPRPARRHEGRHTRRNVRRRAPADPGRPPLSTLARRALVMVALTAVPFTIAMVNQWPSAHSTVRLLTAYSPKRFLHGEVWTLPLSALITAKPTQVSLAIGVMILLMAPYLLLAGFPRTIVRFFAGHIGCTLLTLLVIAVTSAAGWAPTTKLYSTHDMGVSAGLAAVGGAFVVLLWRTRSPWMAIPALAIPLYFYTYRIGYEPAAALMADGEHLAAFAIGMAIEVFWPLRKWPERAIDAPAPAVGARGAPGHHPIG